MHFVAFGHWRAEAAIRAQARAELETKFAERLANASFVERLRLWREMNREIERRVDSKAPHDALY